MAHGIQKTTLPKMVSSWRSSAEIFFGSSALIVGPFKLLVTFQMMDGHSALKNTAVDHQYLELVKATSQRRVSGEEWGEGNF